MSYYYDIQGKIVDIGTINFNISGAILYYDVNLSKVKLCTHETKINSKDILNIKITIIDKINTFKNGVIEICKIHCEDKDKDGIINIIIDGYASLVKQYINIKLLKIYTITCDVFERIWDTDIFKFLSQKDNILLYLLLLDKSSMDELFS